MAEGCTAIFGVIFPSISLLVKYGCVRDFFINFLIVITAVIVNNILLYLGDNAPVLILYSDHDTELLMNRALFVDTLLCIAVVHHFCVVGLSPGLSILNTFLPPLGVFMSTGCSIEFIISFPLTMLGGIPGTIYAHYVAMKELKVKKLEQMSPQITITLDTPDHMVSK